MDRETILKRIEAIRADAGDPESAHGMEDELWSDLLKEISTGAVQGKDAIELATLALTTVEIIFPRWCA